MTEQREPLIDPTAPEIVADYRVVGEKPRRQPFWGPGSEPVVHWGNLWTVVWVIGTVLIMREIVAWILTPIFDALVRPAIHHLFQ